MGKQGGRRSIPLYVGKVHALEIPERCRGVVVFLFKMSSFICNGGGMHISAFRLTSGLHVMVKHRANVLESARRRQPRGTKARPQWLRTSEGAQQKVLVGRGLAWDVVLVKQTSMRRLRSEDGRGGGRAQFPLSPAAATASFLLFYIQPRSSREASLLSDQTLRPAATGRGRTG